VSEYTVPSVTSRSRSNPLALAVLTCLYEKPMHPYEISQTLRARGKQESIRINFGSLYGVVASLERRRLIRAVETVREGKRPERTVYDITESGRTEMNEWLAEVLSVPVKEYVQYEAGLSLLPAIPPDEAIPLLRMRCEGLEIQLDRSDALHEAMEKRGLPRLFSLESEYEAALWRAELEFTRLLIADIESGELSGLDEWRQWHRDPARPNGDEDRHDEQGDAR
jgi:DNA-binding PadR family transcriptional regulator